MESLRITSVDLAINKEENLNDNVEVLTVHGLPIPSSPR